MRFWNKKASIKKLDSEGGVLSSMRVARLLTIKPDFIRKTCADFSPQFVDLWLIDIFYLKFNKVIDKLFSGTAGV